MKYEVSAISDVGNVRKKNEDSILVCRKMFDKKEALLAVVADGMGGLCHGDWASHYVTESLQQWWNTEILPSEKEPDINVLCDTLGYVIEQLHEGIRAEMQRVNSKIGTTLSLIFLYDDEYIIYQVGDSRVYLVDGKALYQLTTDQTWCQEEYDAGRLTRTQMLTHSKRHVLTNAMGIKNEFYSRFVTGQVKKRQRLLLCTDGYYAYLDEEELYRRPFRNDVKVVLEQSADRIREGKAEDNFSAILIEI